MKLKYLLIFITLLIVFQACDKRERTNPFDPEYDPTLWSPDSLILEQISGNEIKLSWQQVKVHIVGFKIDRKKNNETWEVGFTTIDKNSNTYIDNTVYAENTYAYRVYAYSGSNNSSYVEEGIYFDNCGYKIIDYDENEYKTVKIGNQCWMQENLKTTHYTDDTKLEDGTGAGDITGDYTTKYYFAYGDNENNIATYGRLYTWAAIMNGASSSSSNPSGVQGLCPDGWHVPSDAEWTELVKYLGGQNEAGIKLKEREYDHWDYDSNAIATDTSEFTALPSGCRLYNNDESSYWGLRKEAYFWSTTIPEGSPSNPKYLHLNHETAGAYQYNYRIKSSGLSMRCVKN